MMTQLPSDGSYVLYDRGPFIDKVLITEIDLHGMGDECPCHPLVTAGSNIKTVITHSEIKVKLGEPYGPTNNDGS